METVPSVILLVSFSLPSALCPFFPCGNYYHLTYCLLVMYLLPNYTHQNVNSMRTLCFVHYCIPHAWYIVDAP